MTRDRVCPIAFRNALACSDVTTSKLCDLGEALGTWLSCVGSGLAPGPRQEAFCELTAWEEGEVELLLEPRYVKVSAFHGQVYSPLYILHHRVS